MRTHESTHKLWTATLNKMALINESIDKAISDLSNKRNPTKASSATHSDFSKSSLRKNIAAFIKLLCWLIHLISTNLKTRLKCYRSQRSYITERER